MSIRDLDRGYAKRMKALLDKVSISVGVHSEEAGEPEGESGATVGDVAAFHEFGTSTIPRRSFIADWFDESDSENRRMISTAAKLVAGGKMTAEKAGERVGLRAAGDIKRRIVAGIEPPLDPSTEAAKGSSTPLIDTGQLVGAITHKVKKL